MVDILLPQTAIDILPLAPEPVLQWKGKTDICRFIDALYADILPSFSSYLYIREKKSIRGWSKQFIKGAREVLKTEDLKESTREQMLAQAVNIPNFLENVHFGKAAKYVMAWKCCVQTLLEESGFYSLAHILEADEEIGCSLLLASHLYYKQAIQVLRSFIEETILPINFCDNVDAFNQWKANNYRTPSLRGRDGLVKKMVNKGVLPASIGAAVSDLYGDLNSYIHGSEDKLIHKGVHIGSRDGLIFKPVDFEIWCEYLSRSIDIGIRLLRINYVQWENISSIKWDSLRVQGKVLCDVCHNEDDFDCMPVEHEGLELLQPDGTWVEADETFPGFITYVCQHCGNEITVIAAK